MARAYFLSEPDHIMADQVDGVTFCGYDDGQGWTSWFTEQGTFIGMTQPPRGDQTTEDREE